MPLVMMPHISVRRGGRRAAPANSSPLGTFRTVVIVIRAGRTDCSPSDYGISTVAYHFVRNDRTLNREAVTRGAVRFGVYVPYLLNARGGDAVASLAHSRRTWDLMSG